MNKKEFHSKLFICDQSVENEKLKKLFEFYKTFIGKLLVRKPSSGINSFQKTPYMFIKNVESNEIMQWTGIWTEPIDNQQYFSKIVINEAEPFTLLSVVLNGNGRHDFKLNVWFQVLQNDIIGWIKPCEPFFSHSTEIPFLEFNKKYQIFTI